MLKKLMAFACLALSIGANAESINLVTNGGFETGNLTGWSCTTVNLCATTSGAHSGNYAMYGFNNDGFATLSQTISTVAGKNYDFSFYSNTSHTSAKGNILRYQIGSDPIVGVRRTSVYSPTEANYVATGTSTNINFFFETEPGAGVWRIDDVSFVSAVPIPAAAWLFGSAILGLGWVKRRKAA